MDPNICAAIIGQHQTPPKSSVDHVANSKPTPMTVDPVKPAECPAPSNVVIPVPIVHHDGIYAYVAIKGSLHASDSAVFGLNREEVTALSKRFTNGSTIIVNGVLIKAPPLEAINALSQLGYKVVCSTGEAEIIWTLQREL